MIIEKLFQYAWKLNIDYKNKMVIKFANCVYKHKLTKNNNTQDK